MCLSWTVQSSHSLWNPNDSIVDPETKENEQWNEQEDTEDEQENVNNHTSYVVKVKAMEAKWNDKV